MKSHAFEESLLVYIRNIFIEAKSSFQNMGNARRGSLLVDVRKKKLAVAFLRKR